MIPYQAGAIIADPPWRYENWTDAKNGAADSAMVTMPTEEIMALPVGSWARKDCVLALWATWPKIVEALWCMEAWGFDYVTGFPWVKTTPSTGEIRRGVGFWTMGATEALLIGRRGKPKLKKDRERVIGLAVDEPRVLYSPRGKRHSAKPKDVHEWLAEAVEGPYLELFAREDYPGYACWGLDTGVRLTSEGALVA